MESKELIKETGATFTPEKLANFLAEKMEQYGSNYHKPVIVDPACGDGALLGAIGKKWKESAQDFNLQGFDTNQRYLEAARQNLEIFPESHVTLEKADFLEKIDIQNVSELNLFEKAKVELREFADIIIANPPYVRTQVMGSEKAQKLADKFKLGGRVDLYYPFLISMTHALKEGGLIGVITSNRYLVTKSGKDIRRFLYENFEILEVIDLGDTKLFDAAVLPAIFIGRKKSNVDNKTAKFCKIYLHEEAVDIDSHVVQESIFDIIKSPLQGILSDGDQVYKKTSGIIKFPKSKENTWNLLTGEEAEWVQKIEQNSKLRVGDRFKVRVGIKTTADKVFISEDWAALGAQMPEEETLKDLISQENIQPWIISNKVNLKVLYTHKSVNEKNEVETFARYPKAMEYLEANADVLKARTYVQKAGKKWFEIWVPQKAHLWQYPKLVFPDISNTPRFCLDRSGKIVNGNCYWIVASEENDIDFLYLILGVANSKLMTKYHDLVFGNKLYSGRRRYLSQYVNNYPLPRMESKHTKRIIDVVKALDGGVGNEKKGLLIEELEQEVFLAYNV